MQAAVLCMRPYKQLTHGALFRSHSPHIRSHGPCDASACIWMPPACRLAEELVAGAGRLEAAAEALSRAEKAEHDGAEAHSRYLAAVELLGERDEQLEELRADLMDVKELYRDQIEYMVQQLADLHAPHGDPGDALGRSAVVANGGPGGMIAWEGGRPGAHGLLLAGLPPRVPGLSSRRTSSDMNMAPSPSQPSDQHCQPDHANAVRVSVAGTSSMGGMQGTSIQDAGWDALRMHHASHAQGGSGIGGAPPTANGKRSSWSGPGGNAGASTASGNEGSSRAMHGSRYS